MRTDGAGNDFGDMQSRVMAALRVLMGGEEPTEIERTENFKEGTAGFTLCKAIREKKAEMTGLMERGKILEKEMELDIQKMWQHGAAIFGYENGIIMNEDDRHMQLDDKRYRLHLKRRKHTRKFDQ